MKIASDIIDYLNDNYDYYYASDYYGLMELALTDNKPEFFQLFLDEFQSKPDFIENFLFS